MEIVSFIIFQLKLATLTRVQNFSQTATDFRKKFDIWDKHSSILIDEKK
jgi:hypothetical protein